MKAVALVLFVFIALAGVGGHAQGVPRVDLQTSDISIPGRQVVTTVAEFLPRMSTDRHTHPGEMVGYVLEGAIASAQDGQPNRTYRAGESFIIPSGVPHLHANAGDAPARMFVTYIVEKGRPLNTNVSRR
jgi:quercetin dioxygenase-like cupin family protein